jgi:hypothetical protein
VRDEVPYPGQVAEDDEILNAYERELADVRPSLRRSNRGFWIVATTIGLACVLLVGEIFANKPIGDAIGHAEHTLRGAQADAERIRGQTGSFEDADVAGLTATGSDRTYRTADDPSTGLDDVSVVASPTEWAAAVQARPGACFYIRLVAGRDPRYGSGTTCTATAALGADETSW